MIIGVDLDGVVADFNAAFVKKMIAVTGKDLFPARPWEPSVWDYPQHYGYTNREVSAVWEAIKVDGAFWSQLPDYQTTPVDLLELEAREIVQGDDIYFITSRVGSSAKWQSERWLKHRMIKNPTVLISSQKGMCAAALKLDCYIDDKIENVLDVVARSPRTQVFLFSRAWNKSRQAMLDTSVTIVDSIHDMLSIMASSPVTC